MSWFHLRGERIAQISAQRKQQRIQRFAKIANEFQKHSFISRLDRSWLVRYQGFNMADRDDVMAEQCSQLVANHIATKLVR